MIRNNWTHIGAHTHTHTVNLSLNIASFTKITKNRSQVKGTRKTIKVLEKITQGENTGSRSKQRVCGLDSKRMIHKIKNWSLDLIKMKNFSFVKHPIEGIKRKFVFWRKYLQTTCLKKDYYLELSKHNHLKKNKPIRKWTKNMNSYFTQENIQIISRYMKICSTQLAIREIANTK